MQNVHPQLISTENESEIEAPKRLSAKAAHPDGSKLTEAEIEAAETEAEAWARRCNSC
jgi:hypothetical protein